MREEASTAIHKSSGCGRGTDPRDCNFEMMGLLLSSEARELSRDLKAKKQGSAAGVRPLRENLGDHNSAGSGLMLAEPGAAGLVHSTLSPSKFAPEEQIQPSNESADVCPRARDRTGVAPATDRIARDAGTGVGGMNLRRRFRGA